MKKKLIKKMGAFILSFTVMLCSINLNSIKIVEGAISNYQLCWPVAKSARAIGKITSSFGYRAQPTSGASTNHRGIDIGVKEGTQVYAAAKGVVTKVGYSSARGNFVVIYHKELNLSTLYQHLKKYSVAKKQSVKSGEKIALSGKTGVGTGPHLHFGVMKGKATTPDCDQVGRNMAINPLSSMIKYHYYNEEVYYKIKQVSTSNVTRDSVTFNLKMSPKAPVEKVGVFYGTSQSEIKKITKSTKHENKGGYKYYLLNYNAKKTKIENFSFDTKKKTQNGYKISLKAGTTYYYKMVALVDGSWIISSDSTPSSFTTKNNPPSAVSGISVKESKIGRGGKATISWKQSSSADSYKISVKNSSGALVYPTATNKGLTNISYTTNAITEPGEYTVSITAVNSSGSSSEKTVKFTVMSDLRITFDSGIVGSEPEIKTVIYHSSTKTPAAPKREGYTFNGWKNQTTGKVIAASTDIKNILSSENYTAVWTANKYTIKVIDGIDNTVLKESKEPYDSVIRMSEYYTQELPVHKNYKFVGWSEEEYTLNNTNSHAIYARYEWDSDNQVVTKIKSVKRASSTGKSTDGTDGYSIDVTVTAPALKSGSKNPIIRGRVVAVLKTEAGRMLICIIYTGKCGNQ